MQTVEKDTHLDGHEEDFGDQDHDGDVVWRVYDSLRANQLLNRGEEVLDKLLEGDTLLLNFKFKCLEE